MKPDKRFVTLPKTFWADVRVISQKIGYSVRGKGLIKVPTRDEIRAAYAELSLQSGHLFSKKGKPTKRGRLVLDYFQFRSDVLHKYVKPSLMNASEAKTLFEKLSKKLNPKCPIPMNKQRGDKRAPAFFTSVINMLVESNANGLPCDYDPRVLTTVTKDGMPLRTFARRIDGAFPGAIDPVAVWEIKEYYYTTTFGSRVADAVYESLLDGMEIEELALNEGAHVKHYLMVDAYYTWWDCGRSYLCRIVDMLHMGYVDEVLFGREVVSRLPELVKEWASIVAKRTSA